MYCMYHGLNVVSANCSRSQDRETLGTVCNVCTIHMYACMYRTYECMYECMYVQDLSICVFAGVHLFINI